MAGNIKGITLEINGSTTKLVNALKAPIKESRELQTSLKNVNTALKLDPKNVDLLNQKQQLLTKTISSTQNELDILKEAQKQYIASGKDLNSNEYTELEKKIAQTEASLKRLKDEQVDFNGKVQVMGQKLQEFGDKTEKAGKALLPLTAGVAGIGTASVAAFNELDEGYDTIITKTGATGEAADALADSMDAVFGSLPTTAADAGIAIGEVNTRFGSTGEELEDLSRIFIQFAQINETDLNSAIGKVDKNLEAFGLSANDAQGYMGLLTERAQATGISVDTLMDGVSKNGSVFKEMGLSIDESVSLLAMFEQTGIDSTAALAGLKKAQQNATAEGKTLSQSLSESVDRIKNASSETEALQIATELFGKKGALEMVHGLREGRISLDDLSKNLDDFSGTVATTFDATLDPPDKLAVALNNLKITGKELGGSILEALAPSFDKIAEAAKKLAAWFSGLSDSQKNMVLVVGGLAAAIGPVLIAIGKMSSGIGAIMAGAKNLSGPLKAVQTAIGGISAPVLAVAAAIGLLVAAFVDLWNNNEEFRTNILAIWTEITETLSSFFQGIVDRINALGFSFSDITEVIKTIWNGFCEFLAPVFEGAFQYISDTLSTVLDVMTGLFDVFSGIFTGNWDLVWQGVQEVFTGIWDGIKNWFENILDTMKNVLDVVCGWFGTTWEDTWNGISQFFTDIWNGIKTFFEDTWNNLTTFCSNTWNGIKDTCSNVWNGIKDNIINPISQAWNKVSEVFGNIYNWIKEKIEGTRDTVSGAIDAIKGFFNFEFKWPHIPLPHFSISGSLNPLDWIDGGLPSIGVEWYAKAMPKGMILDGPTIFGMQNGKLLGGGESGKEVVVGAQSLMQMIDSGIRNAMNLASPISSEPVSIDFSPMENCLRRAIADAKVEVSLVVDGRTLARQIVKPMDQELAKLNMSR